MDRQGWIATISALAGIHKLFALCGRKEACNLPRKGRKDAQVRHVLVAALVVVFVLSSAVPAAGGPGALSSASPVKLAEAGPENGEEGGSEIEAGAREVQRRRRDKHSDGVVGAFHGRARGVGSGIVTCPLGTVVISGGYLLTGAEANVFFDRRSGNGWTLGVDNVAAGDPATGSPTAQFTIDVQCAATGDTVVSSRSASADRRRDRRLVEQRRAEHRRAP